MPQTDLFSPTAPESHALSAPEASDELPRLASGVLGTRLINLARAAVAMHLAQSVRVGTDESWACRTIQRGA